MRRSRDWICSRAVHAIGLVGATACTFVFFAVVYRTVPQQRPDWCHAAAALVSTVLVALGQAGFALYLHFANVTSAYGEVGSCIAALTGAEIARAVAK